MPLPLGKFLKLKPSGTLAVFVNRPYSGVKEKKRKWLVILKYIKAGLLLRSSNIHSLNAGDLPEKKCFPYDQ